MQPKHEPIAVIGIGCRLPGADNPDAYWNLLIEGRDAIGEVPPDRWDIDRLYDPEPATPGKMYTRRGAFLDHVADFDPTVFGISGREAEKMDPQQRLLLEVTWEAFENAGIPVKTLGNSQTGVYVGISNSDYARLMFKGLDSLSAYSATGTSLSIAANRISYLYNFRGPSLSIDTACSSSLVAAHLACQGLQRGETDLAVAAGVNLILTPEGTITFCQARMMAPDGRCKTFDAKADGYVRGEGCGALILKRLEDAQRDGNRILAVIYGSAVNQDGLTNGLTAPNGPSQQEVLRAALAAAGMHSADIELVEAHGTGTSLGDPIEVRSLKTVLGQGHDETRPLRLASVKTNIGHLEAAAGVAGLLKLVLSLSRGQIPPHLNFETLNPYIDLRGAAVEIVTQASSWNAPIGKRVAGVSAFGFGGTNCHMIVGDYVAAAPAKQAEPVVDRPRHVLPLSAQTQDALPLLAERYAQRLEDADVTLADLAHSVAVGRSALDVRRAVVAATKEEAIGALHKLAEKASSNDPGQAVARRRNKVAFLFTGQGSQYPGMGRALYEAHPVYRAAIDRCAAELKKYDVPLLDVLFAEDQSDTIHQTALSQPTLFATEYALYELWKSWGITPSFAIGHSVGEYVAACAAEVFSLEDGLKLIALRGKLMQSLPTGGAMLAVSAPSQRVSGLLNGKSEAVSVAAVNSPQQTVLSGAAEAIEHVAQLCQAEGIRATRLTVSHAFHSRLMDPILDQFEQAVASIEMRPAAFPIAANLTGEITRDAFTNPEYWRRHLREAVRFADGIQAIADKGGNVFLEIGPQPVLSGLGRATISSKDSTWLPSLRSGRDDWQTILQSVGELYELGIAIDWNAFDAPYARRRVELPTYPFVRSRFWAPDTMPSIAQDDTLSTGSGLVPARTSHPLLGVKIPTATDEVLFQTSLSPGYPAYLADHQLFGSAVFPATGYVELALAAAKEHFQTGQFAVEMLQVQQPLVFEGQKAKTVQVLLLPEETGSGAFRILSAETSESNDTIWKLHAAGRIAPAAAQPEKLDLQEAFFRMEKQVDLVDFYQQAKASGLVYGPTFQGIRQLGTGQDESLAEVTLPTQLQADARNYTLHPALLDACFQTVGSLLQADLTPGTTFIPIGVASVTCYEDHSPQRVACHATVTGRKAGRMPQVEADVTLTNEEGEVLAQVRGLRLARLAKLDLQKRLIADVDRWYHEMKWIEAPRIGSPLTVDEKAESVWLLFGDNRPTTQYVAEQLRLRKQEVMLVYPGTELEYGAEDALIDPAEPEQFVQLLASLKLSEARKLRGVVYLWADQDTGQGAEESLVQQATGCQGLLHLAQALGQLEGDAPRLYVATLAGQAVAAEDQIAHPLAAATWGLAGVIANEMPKLQCTRIDIDADDRTTAGRLFGEIWVPDQETEIALRGEQRYTPRLVSLRLGEGQLTVPEQPYQLGLRKFGVLTNLELTPKTLAEPGPTEVEIELRASGLNFRDVLRALGMLQEYEKEIGILSEADVTFGFEGAGVVRRVGSQVKHLHPGDEVIALSTASMTSHLLVDERYVAKKPAGLSFEEAATLPLAFLTAHYGLVHLAKLRKGDKVLIHAAAGGVGQAAVAIAQAVGAEIYATASQGKWDFLRSLGIEHIYDSRTTTFADQILEATDDRGVDVVLNSLNQEFIGKSIEALAEKGRFVEIGKIGIWTQDEFAAKRPAAGYFPFDLGEEERSQPGLIAQLLAELLPQFESGALQPLPLKVYPIEEAVEAFRFMQQARHLGKVVLQITPPTGQRPLVRPDATYLITGGTGAIGLELAGWLVEQGATSLVLTNRSGKTPEAAAEQLAAWEKAGVKVTVSTMDAAQADQVAAVLVFIQTELPPLAGVFHAAGVLDDATLAQQSWERFAKVLPAKVDGSWYLHQQTRHLPLDYFVCFSSIAALIGSPGQANYAAANAFMDALCAARRSQGLPGLSINWGPWSGGGMANAADARRLAGIGLGMIAPAEGLLALEELLTARRANVGAFPVQWPKFLKQFSRNRHPRLLDELATIHRQQPTAASAGGGALRDRLQAADEEGRARLVADYVAEQAAKTLGISAAQLDRAKALAEMGLDSLMGIELKNGIEAELDVEIPVEEFSADTTVTSLAAAVARLIGVEGDVSAESQPVGTAAAPTAAAAAKQKPERRLEDIPPADYQTDQFPEVNELQERIARFARMGMENPYFDVHEGTTRDTAIIDGREMICFSSYNYVGSSGDPEVSAAAQAAIDRYGTSVSASRVVSGEKPIHGQLERRIAQFVGAEAAICFVGGHSTNETTIGHLMNPGDLILHDELAHNSLIQGCILSGAQRRAFPHNDTAACERMLAEMRGKYRRAVIVVEGVYSMDGDYCDLPKLVEIKEKYKALLFVDEAHSIGTMGKTGRGICEYFGIPGSRVDFLMATLSKSLGSCGGYIAGKKRMIDYLKYTAPGFVFSVGMPPSNAAAALASLERIEKHPEVVTQCIENSKLFLRLAKERGLDTGLSNETPVVPVITGNSFMALKLSRRLYARGINVQPIMYPAVEEKAARLRFFITSCHREEQIRQTVDATAQELEKLKAEAD